MEDERESSSVNSITECINDVFFESELEASSVQSISVTEEVANDEKTSTCAKHSLEMFTRNKNGTETKTFKRFRFRKMYLAALAALIHALSVGFCTTYTATATEDMNRTTSAVRPTKDEISWIGSLLALGALLGAIAGGHLSHTLGRKGTLIISAVPFIAGWLLIAYAKNLAFIYSGRIISGFCSGLASIAGPIYVVEISTPEVRGFLGTTFQLFFVTGQLFVSCLGTYLRWTWLAVAGSFISFLSFIAMLFVPESPRWLMQKGKVSRAKKALKLLQGKDFNVDKECCLIQEDINSQSIGNFKLNELLSPAVYKSFLFSLSIHFFQQFSGIYAILFYTVAIFRNAGSSLNPHYATIIIGAVQLVATLVGSILVDRTGRKVLLFLSGICMTIDLIAMGTFNFLTRSDPEVLRKSYGWMPILILVFYITTYSFGFGAVPGMMMVELTSTRFRSVIISTVVVFSCIFVFIVTKTFSDLESRVRDYGIYWLYASSCLISCFFTYFVLPETKGKTLEEIQQILSKRTKSSSRKLQHGEQNFKIV